MNYETAPQRDAENERPLPCPECGAVLGESTARVLRVGAVRFQWQTMLCCDRCGRRLCWRPTREQRE